MSDAAGDTEALEAAILAALASEDERPPAAIAMDLDVALERVLDRARALQERGLLGRAGFSTCVLTEAGREAAAARDAGGVGPAADE